MKKLLLKNLIALAFSLGALVFMAGNVFAPPLELTVYMVNEDEDDHAPPGEDEDGGEVPDPTYCITKITSGIGYTRPCIGYDPGILPPYICGSIMLFTAPAFGSFPPPESVQCHFAPEE